MVGSPRQGWVIFAAMWALFVAGLGGALWAEQQPNSVLAGLPNLEGKETRFGVMNSVLWGTATTAASNGSVNAMHDSFSPVGGLVTMFNLMLGEVIFGGVGAGLYGMLMCVLLTVFLAGLMVGRTPEYLGKHVEAREVMLAMIAVLAPCGVVLLLSALACLTPSALASLNNAGPHGLSEILYAFASMANNNGIRVRRPERQHAVLQPARRAHDGHRPVRRDSAGARHRRQPGRQRSSPRRRPARSRRMADSSSCCCAASC